MPEPPGSFSTSIPPSQKINYGCGAIGLLLLAVYPVWVVITFITNSEVRSSELPGLIFFLVVAAILLFSSFFFWSVIFRERLTIDSRGVIYQSAFNRTSLAWNEIEGFATIGNSVYLVYNSSKLARRPRWMSKLIKPQPLIPLSPFIADWPQKGKSVGPLMAAIFQHAPQLHK
jgi:hypothetical protein